MRALAAAWEKPRGLLLDVLPACAYLAALFWFGLTPLDHLPGPDFALLDKLWHAGAFGGLAGLLARTLRFAGRSPLAAAQQASLASAALGGVLELLQSFTAYRSADWADFAADALGVALAYGVLRGLHAAARPETAPG